uniref:Transmembrane protein n=1 Tax=Steinernema glaseri TaxID=37863 RepID=A0A1I7YV88_9BILA
MEQRAVHCMILRKNLPKDPSDDRPSRKMTTEEDVRIPTDCERFRACTCLRACQPSSLFALFSSFLVLCSSDTDLRAPQLASTGDFANDFGYGKPLVLHRSGPESLG